MRVDTDESIGANPFAPTEPSDKPGQQSTDFAKALQQAAPDAAAPASCKPASLRDATQTLLNNFDKIVDGRKGLDRWFSDPSTLNRGDLERLVTDPDPSIPQDLRDAAQLILDSKVDENFLDLGAGKGGFDGQISREDLQSALKAIDSGHYYEQLLDTAAGRGGGWFSPARDGYVSADDIKAALEDPGVPPALKDTLRMLELGPDGAEGAAAVLKALTPQDAQAISELYRSGDFAALPRQDQQLIAETLHDNPGNGKIVAELQAMIHDPSFQKLDAAHKSARLAEYNLLHSTEFDRLAPGDQKLVRDALAAAPHDAKLAASIKSLIASKDFSGLDAAAKTAVLSQVKNYPSEKVAYNLQRLVGKGWFKGYDSGDKQRALKLIAYMSFPRSGEDAHILNDTLEKFLGANAPYSLKIESLKAPPGNITFGQAANGVMTINQDLVTADNNKLENGPQGFYARQLAVDTISHEINHLVNGDKVAPTFNYLNDEYRAWYVGHQAANGKPPTNGEAIDRWKYFLTPGGGYWDLAAKDALKNPAEAAKIFDELSRLTGVHVDAKNYKQVLDHPSSWKTDPNAPAAVVPPGNLDNS